jgi:hypothetical protein
LLPGRPNPAETQKPKIRHTGVSWPDGQDRPRIETAIKDIGGVGYHGLETSATPSINTRKAELLLIGPDQTPLRPLNSWIV